MPTLEFIISVLLLAGALLTVHFIAQPIAALVDVIRDFRNSNNRERCYLIGCSVAVSLFFLVICTAPTVYQSFKNF